MLCTEDEYEDSGRNEATENTVYLSNYESQQGMQQEAYICQVLLSVAETALRESSGEARPLKCWGCAEIPAYEKDCFHRFGDCSRKSDPCVSANFKKNIEKWVQ